MVHRFDAHQIELKAVIQMQATLRNKAVSKCLIHLQSIRGATVSYLIPNKFLNENNSH